jgi:hypothetical protein
MKITNPLTGNMEPIQSVLYSLSGQEGCDGEPYDQMYLAAEHIDLLEVQLQANRAERYKWTKTAPAEDGDFFYTGKLPKSDEEILCIVEGLLLIASIG